MTTDVEPPAAVLLDVNLIMWAYHERFPHHARARGWLEHVLSTTSTVGIPWPTIIAFIRLSTDPRVLSRPVPAATVQRTVAAWLALPNVMTPVPTDGHAALLADVIRRGGASGNHVPDAHLAALAIDWGLTVLSADHDFARYPVRWIDPSEAW